MADLVRLMEVLESEGPVSASRLSAALAVSQPTLSRLLAKAGSRVLRIGRARATRYVARRALMGNDNPIALFAIDAKGRPEHIAELHGLARDQYYVDTTHGDFWLRGEAGNGLYESLPYFLHDVRPQGFMGRQIARRYARTHGYPEDPRNWSDAQAGMYFIQEGYDLPGHVVVGEQSMAVFQSQLVRSVENREKAYPELARRVLLEGIPGSSAGGEQQKFTCYAPDIGHVIVKFSPAGDTEEALRWRDLLICEHHALCCLSDAGLSASSTRLFEYAGRVFLEVKRFDRVGESGRVPMLSLSTIDAEFVGLGQSWAKVAVRLHEHRLIDSEDVRTCLHNEIYAQWIGNTDRHLGNVSMTMTMTDTGFALFPAYDMLPMVYAPERGEIIPRSINYPVRPMQHEHLWRQAGMMAHSFWNRVSQDSRVSAEFRKLAEMNLQQIQRILD